MSEDMGYMENGLPSDMATPEHGDIVGRAGTANDAKTTARASEEAVIEACGTVYDPEIPVNIYELGLIYAIAIDADGNVKIDMTLTAPGCPVAGILPQQVADAAAGVPGAGEVQVILVWEPAWTPDKMSEDARLALGFF